MGAIRNYLFFISRKQLYSLVVFSSLCLSNHLKAAQGVATTGNWENSSTWTINGSNRLPSCGDTLLIPSGVTVTVGTHMNYVACLQNMFVTINGTLQLINGNKIDLPCASSVVVNTGGTLKKATPGGGNSTYVTICGCVSWVAAQGTITGPRILNCSLLPISLLSFTADEKEEGVLLEWATASETNNEYFSLERSADGIEFYPIGQVSGSGTTSEMKAYSFTDMNPLKGRAYYRLRQTDYDGLTSLSETVAVNYKMKRKLKFIETFVDNNRQLNLSVVNNTSLLKLVIYDLYGKQVLNSDLKSTDGLNELKLNLADIPGGSYIFLLSNGEEKVTKNVFVAN